MTRPYPSHNPRSEIKPKMLSEDSYISEIKNKKRGLDGHPGLIGTQRFPGLQRFPGP
jgi:hypothetical protein